MITEQYVAPITVTAKELPQSLEPVLAWDASRHDWFEARYSAGKWYGHNRTIPDTLAVSHWVPLPPAPRAGN